MKLTIKISELLKFLKNELNVIEEQAPLNSVSLGKVKQIKRILFFIKTYKS